MTVLYTPYENTCITPEELCDGLLSVLVNGAFLIIDEEVHRTLDCNTWKPIDQISEEKKGSLLELKTDSGHVFVGSLSDSIGNFKTTFKWMGKSQLLQPAGDFGKAVSWRNLGAEKVLIKLAEELTCKTELMLDQGVDMQDDLDTAMFLTIQSKSVQQQYMWLPIEEQTETIEFESCHYSHNIEILMDNGNVLKGNRNHLKESTIPDSWKEEWSIRNHNKETHTVTTVDLRNELQYSIGRPVAWRYSTTQ